MTTSTTKKQTATQAKAPYGSKDNPLTPLDALEVASVELERLCCVLEDMAESTRAMIQLADMDSERREYAAMLRIFERVLNSEFDECSKADERICHTIRHMKSGGKTATE